jgi:chromate transport protein ChrA
MPETSITRAAAPGPIAVVGYMQRDLVEARGWISKQDFLDGVALGQTMPGPLAAQVAMWAGYLKGGAAGAAATLAPQRRQAAPCAARWSS